MAAKADADDDDDDLKRDSSELSPDISDWFL
jgi:hypothetical protein